MKVNTCDPRQLATGLVRRPTCDVEVRVAGGFAHFVGDDALVDASVHVADGADDQAVHVADCSSERQPEKRVKTFYLMTSQKLPQVSDLTHERVKTSKVQD